MNCPNCGKENSDQNKICLSCGKELSLKKDIIPQYNSDDDYINPGEQQVEKEDTEIVEESNEVIEDSKEIENHFEEDDDDAITRPLDIQPEYDVNKIDSSIENAKEKSLNKPNIAEDKKNKKTMIIISVCAAILVVIALVFAFILIKNNKKDQTKTTFSENTSLATTTTKVTTTTTVATTQTPTTVDQREAIVKASNGVFDYDGFVFPFSSESILNDNDLMNMASKTSGAQSTREFLEFARNEIFARHGQSFTLQRYSDHFNVYDWYKRLSKRQVTESMLNDYEKENLKIIEEWQKRYQ